MSYQDISDKAVSLRQSATNRAIEDLLDKHGFKGKTPEELRLMGYYPAETENGFPFDEKRTWTLYKYVDSTSFRFKINVSAEPVDA